MCDEVQCPGSEEVVEMQFPYSVKEWFLKARLLLGYKYHEKLLLISDLWAGSLEEHPAEKKPAKGHLTGKEPAKATRKEPAEGHPVWKEPAERHPVEKEPEAVGKKPIEEYPARTEGRLVKQSVTPPGMPKGRSLRQGESSMGEIILSACSLFGKKKRLPSPLSIAIRAAQAQVEHKR
ncbi:hypothetical protein BHE74_00003212 [Ensete ventricosum]|nr:hypothetical protein BHE74_00003212 [Ensete ventricosum]